MWPFRANSRLSALEEDFRKLKRDFEGLSLEWLETLQRLKKTMGRIVKSTAILEAKEPTTEEPAIEIPQDGASPVAGFLSPRQKIIQQQILRRRAGLR